MRGQTILCGSSSGEIVAIDITLVHAVEGSKSSHCNSSIICQNVL